MTTPDGVGGTQSSNYRYGGMVMEHLGKGSKGFSWTEVTSAKTNAKTRTEFYQDYPFIGIPKKVQGFSDGVLLSEQESVYDYRLRSAIRFITKGPQSLNKQNVNDQIIEFWMSEQSNKSYSPQGAHIQTVITKNEAPDAYGNMTNIKVTTEDHENNQTWAVESINTFDNDASDWVLGRLLTSKAIHDGPDGNRIIKEASFEYDDEGVLIGEITEPNNASLYKRVTYSYDSYGHKNRVTSAIAGHSRETRKTTTYDAVIDGVSVRKVVLTNALGHSEESLYSLEHGGLLKQTGPNGLSTSWQYDVMGRKVFEDRADGTWTRWTYEYSDWTGARFKNGVESSGSPISYQYYDTHGRVVRKSNVSLDGRRLFRDTRYNDLGQKVFTSRPYFEGEAVYGGQLIYNQFGLLTEQVTPGANGEEIRTRYEYDGFKETVIYANGSRKTLTKNAKGQVLEVNDRGAIIKNEYDALGHVVRVENAKGLITTIAYDNVGNKTGMIDPVLGYSYYIYNGFGELFLQRNEQGGTFNYNLYDVLGRKVYSANPDGSTTWVYDTGSGKGIGKLASSRSSLGIGKTYSYDDLGRTIKSESEFQGQTHVTESSYDNLSRIASTKYPGGLEVNNVYNDNGHLIAVQSPKSQVTDYSSEFMMRQYQKAQRYRQLIDVDIEGYRKKAALYAQLAQAYKAHSLRYNDMLAYSASGVSNSNWEAKVTRNVAKANEAIKQLEDTVAYYQGRIAEANTWKAIYGNAERHFRNYLEYFDEYRPGHNLDSYFQGEIDYYEEKTQFHSLKAEKYIALADEITGIQAQIDRIHNTSYQPVAGAYAPHGWWHSIYAGYDHSVGGDLYTVVSQFQKKADKALIEASSIAEEYNNYLSLLGDSAYDRNNVTWYRVAKTDVEGRITRALYGNSLMSSFDYDQASGYLMGLQTGNMYKGANTDIQDLEFSYDAMNNLVSKQDHVLTRQESMSYDHMDRILTHSVVAPQQSYNHTYSYNDHGDILSGPAGNYLYGDYQHQSNTLRGVLLSVGGVNVHYDALGNMTRAVNGTQITYNGQNKPILFEKGINRTGAYGESGSSFNRTGFAYDESGSRFLKTVNGVQSLYIGKIYEKNLASGDEVNHIYFGGKHIASYEKRGGGHNLTSYMHKDALGSVDVVTNAQGNVIKRYAYDAFGKRHELTTKLSQAKDGFTHVKSNVDRGYTGHEHFNVGDDASTGFIHMNGRVYDQNIGRFLSADPHIQAPSVAMSHNRYAYVLNNPYKYTDPSGYFFKKFFNWLGERVRQLGNWIKENEKALGAALLAAVGGWAILYAQGVTFGTAGAAQLVAVGAFGGAVTGGINSGSFAGAFKGAIFGAFSAGVAFGIVNGFGNGLTGWDAIAKAGAHGIAQGGLSAAQGGDFWSGFVSAAAGSYVPAGDVAQKLGIDSIAGRTIVASVTGGTASALTGGSFANGAQTAAYVHLFNGETRKQFEKFMDFIGMQSVERGESDPFIHEKVANSKADLPDSIANYEPDGWAGFVDDRGNHEWNQRLPGGYHLTTDLGRSGVYVHYDALDPLNGAVDTGRHIWVEVGNSNTYVDNHPDWGAQ